MLICFEKKLTDGVQLFRILHDHVFGCFNASQWLHYTHVTSEINIGGNCKSRKCWCNTVNGSSMEGNLVCLKELIQAGAWNSAKLQWPELWCFWPTWKDQGNVEISVMNTNLETHNLRLEMGPRIRIERCIRLALQSARRSFKINNTVLKKRLVHMDYPLITCFSVNTEGACWTIC